MDGPGRIQYANGAVRTFLGVDEAALSGGFLTSFSHEEDSEFFQTLFAELVEGDRDDFQVVSRCKIGDGTIAWWRVDMRAVRIPESIPFMIAVVDDVTSQKNDEERLRRAKELAEAATRTKSSFLANMSHEIRTPLHTINGMAELLRETNMDEEQLEYLHQIQFAGEVLLGLINDILDFSKIEAGRLQLEKISYDPVKTIEDAVDMVSMQAHRKGLEVVLYVDDRLPRYAEGDPNRIRQVLVNLVNNAVKFTAEGSIRVRAELRTAKGVRRILLQVKDTGIGIPEDRQDRLFQPFSQVDASMTRKFGGTGLGLSISRDLVGMMDGRIGVKSKPGLGSNFWFSLPLEMASSETVAFPAPSSVHPGFKALIIDDAQESAQTISEYLNRWQVSTVIERSAAAGIEEMTNAIVRGGGYDIVLIDLRLPDMDGWQLASEVRNDPVLEKTPLVLMSPLGESTGDAKMKLLRWFDAYLNKPVKVRELASAVEQIFAGDIEELEAIDAEPVELEEVMEDGDRLPETVLVAEDHFVNQQLFQTILEKQGFRTLVASDGLEAVEAVRSNPEIGLIFMDVQMPNLNGYDATSRIRDLGFVTPIIAVTANALSGDRDRCIRVGMNEYMSKPFKKSDIEAVLGRLRAAGAFRTDKAAAGAPSGPVGDTASSDDTAAAGVTSPAGAPSGLVGDTASSSDTAPAGNAVAVEEAAGPVGPGDDDAELEELVSVFDGGEPPIDLREAIEAFMGDAATTERVVRKFADRIAGQIDEVVEHLDAGRISDARVVSHAVKGGAWNLHCADLGDASKAVEDACAAEDAEAAHAGIPAMRKEAARLKSYVETVDFSAFE